MLRSVNHIQSTNLDFDIYVNSCGHCPLTLIYCVKYEFITMLPHPKTTRLNILVNLLQVCEAQEALSESARPDTEMIIGGTTLLTPNDMLELLLGEYSHF